MKDQTARVERLPAEVKGLVAPITAEKLRSSQWAGITTELVVHFKKIGWPGPGYGWDNGLKDLLTHHPNSAADNAAIAQGVKAASEKSDALAAALAKIKIAHADAVKASAEIARLESELLKTNDGLAKAIAR